MLGPLSEVVAAHVIRCLAVLTDLDPEIVRLHPFALTEALGNCRLQMPESRPN